MFSFAGFSWESAEHNFKTNIPQKVNLVQFTNLIVPWDWPSPRMPVANEGLGWDPLLRIFDNPGAHCYWEGATPKTCLL